MKPPDPARGTPVLSVRSSRVAAMLRAAQRMLGHLASSGRPLGTSSVEDRGSSLARLTGLRTPSPMKAVKRQAGTLGGQRFFPEQYRFLLGTPSPMCPRAQQSTSGHTTELDQSTLPLRNLCPAYPPSSCLLANPRAHRGLWHLP